MLESFISELMKYAPVAVQFAIRGFIIFLISLASVYVFGRMLEIIHTDRAKNSLALVVSIATSWYSAIIYDTEIVTSNYELYFRVVVYVAISVIFYVLAGFDLYDRFNVYCDKKIKGKKH